MTLGHRHRSRSRDLRTAVVLGAVWAAGMPGFAGVAQADWQRAPWCAYLGGFGGNFDCSYYTFEQCMATARGLGGYCSPNPRAASYEAPRQRRRNRSY
jgi:Protein of unknown function (DUF3551)